ncbi:MAG: hypothetical protein AAGD43_02615 [Pseudomonadota bacterium]
MFKSSESYGPELITNSSFDTSDDWTASGTGTSVIGSGVATITKGPNANQEAQQSLTLVSGADYLLAVDCQSIDSVWKAFLSGREAFGFINKTGLVSAVIAAPAASVNFRLVVGGLAGSVGVFNSASLRRVLS